MMGTSARLFGLSPESILLPQAVMGVLTTFLIYLLVRRNFSAIAALTAAIVFFTTPIITLMSRYNNPDPLMLLLMVAAAYFVVRTVETGRARYFAYAGLILGLGFMTKQLQAMLSLPALAVAFLVCSHMAWWPKIRTCCIGLITLIFAGGLWMSVVELVPPAARPYIGGSTENSVLQLTLAYNGFNRLVPAAKDPTVSLIPAPFRSVESDQGLLRLLNGNFAQEAGWLLLVALLSCFWLPVGWRRLTATRGRKATVILSAGWFITTYLMLSFMGDGIHSYYTSTLAPPLALIIGIGVEALLVWNSKKKARLAASFTVAAGTLVAWALMNTVSDWSPLLLASMLASGLAGAALLAVPPPVQWLNIAACTLSAVGLVAAPLATSIYTAAVPHSGSNPLSGPLTKSTTSISRFLDGVSRKDPGWAYDIGFGFDPGPNLVKRINDTSTCTWGAATYPSQSAAKLQLASSRAVIPIGGFAGMDPAPTLSQFTDHVSRGNICFLVWHQDHLELPDRSATLMQISDWVKSRYQATTIDGAIVYDLRQPIEASLENRDSNVRP
jgi:4-amino-4-deoxy-L-arabinose transferase-like glycosyltransferase